jgi:hypothetical protein
MKDGKYVQHVPGFLKKDKHPGWIVYLVVLENHGIQKIK